MTPQPPGIWASAFLEALNTLPEHPHMYRPSSRVPGCREIVAHPNYIVLYRVGLSSIDVIRVIHARREYP
ncbi:MAG: type II toxin-antitoxin system RelE/ParE family toxin [Burkholderiaceae bacterium]|nr:type II toxin-antitoxin system RelE/ParE family toxin [Burkholderiaceae bacterium]